jgi:hypothetical protein
MVMPKNTEANKQHYTDLAFQLVKRLHLCEDYQQQIRDQFLILSKKPLQAIIRKDDRPGEVDYEVDLAWESTAKIGLLARKMRGAYNFRVEKTVAISEDPVRSVMQPLFESSSLHEKAAFHIQDKILKAKEEILSLFNNEHMILDPREVIDTTRVEDIAFFIGKPALRAFTENRCKTYWDATSRLESENFYEFLERIQKDTSTKINAPGPLAMLYKIGLEKYRHFADEYFANADHNEVDSVFIDRNGVIMYEKYEGQKTKKKTDAFVEMCIDETLENNLTLFEYHRLGKYKFQL